MKILFVTHYGELYGANLSLCNVAQEINKRGQYTAELLSLTDLCEQLEEYCKAINIKLYKMPFYNTCYPAEQKNYGCMKSALKYYLNKIQIKKLDDFFKENHYEFIHSNTMATLVGAMLAKRHGIAHIWHIREFMEEDYNSMQYMGPGYKDLLAYTCKFIAISKAIAHKYRDSIPAEKIKLVYNGIPFAKEDVVPNRNRKKMVFALSGIIRKEKGTLEAVQAFNLLLSDERVRETILEAELWIIGGGLEKRNDTYIQKVISEGEKYPDKVKFLGYRKDIIHLMAQIDIGLVCSWREAFGRITIEYMQNGVFVIGADCGGTSELINDKITGALYKPRDINDLKEKMLYCLLNPEEVKRISGYAEKYAKGFSIEACVDGITATYTEVLSIKR